MNRLKFEFGRSKKNPKEIFEEQEDELDLNALSLAKIDTLLLYISWGFFVMPFFYWRDGDFIRNQTNLKISKANDTQPLEIH